VTRLDHTSRPNMIGLICLWMANVADSDHRSWPSLMSLDLSRRDLFNGTSGIVTGASVCFQDLFIYKEERREKKNKETKKRLWIHIETPIMTSLVLLKKSRRDKSNDIKKGQAVTGVCHTSRPKANERWHIWTARVTHSSHCLWHFLVLLDSPRQNLFNSIGDVVIGLSVCLQDFIFLFLCFFSLLSSLYLLKIISVYF